MENIQDVTVSIGEAAKELGVSVDTVRRWADADKLKSVRAPSGHRRFYLTDLNLYGSRSKKNKKLLDGMTQVVKDVQQCF